MYRTIEIGGHTNHPIGKRLSNFFERAFVFDGVKCASFEGWIQSVKCHDSEAQKELCKLVGKEAWKAGQAHNDWKNKGTLYWQGTTYGRTSRAYMLLVARVYDAIYDQNPEFKADLLALGDSDIWHSIGKAGPHNTTLTEVEMLLHYERLRRRAIQEQVAGLLRI